MDRTVVSYVHDGGASGFVEQPGRVASVRGQRENRFIQAEVFVSFRWNLAVAAGSLQQQKAVSFGSILQRSAVGKRGQEVNQVLNPEILNVLLKPGFRAAGPEVNRKSFRTDLAFRLESGQRTEEWDRIPLPGINQPGM